MTEQGRGVADTTWNKDRIPPGWDEWYSFNQWLDQWFENALTPSAQGGFEAAEAGEGQVIISCRNCGALVVHGGGPHPDEVVHLNAHRHWHDQLDGLLAAAETQPGKG